MTAPMNHVLLPLSTRAVPRARTRNMRVGRRNPGWRTATAKKATRDAAYCSSGHKTREAGWSPNAVESIRFERECLDYSQSERDQNQNRQYSAREISAARGPFKHNERQQDADHVAYHLCGRQGEWGPKTRDSGIKREQNPKPRGKRKEDLTGYSPESPPEVEWEQDPLGCIHPSHTCRRHATAPGCVQVPHY